jgi:hypothetical protein
MANIVTDFSAIQGFLSFAGIELIGGAIGLLILIAYFLWCRAKSTLTSSAPSA